MRSRRESLLLGYPLRIDVSDALPVSLLCWGPSCVALYTIRSFMQLDTRTSCTVPTRQSDANPALNRASEGARNFRRMPPVIDGEFNCPSNASWNPCADSAGRPICRIRVRVPCHKPILQPQNRHFQKIVTHRGDHKDHHKIRAPPNDHHKM